MYTGTQLEDKISVLESLAQAAEKGDEEAAETLARELKDPRFVVLLLNRRENSLASHYRRGLEKIASCETHVKGDVVDVARETLKAAGASESTPLPDGPVREAVVARLRKAKMLLFGSVSLAVEEALSLLDPEPPFEDEEQVHEEGGLCEPDEAESTYPCSKCGKPRTKAEGGTTFTVCDDCWDVDSYAKKDPAPATDDQVAEIEANATAVYKEHQIGTEAWFRAHDAWRAKWTPALALSLAYRIHQMGAEYRILLGQFQRTLKLQATEAPAGE